jgi:hypothetical protein
VRGLIAVSLGLIGLQVLLTSPLNELIPAVSYLTTLAGRWIDPTVPLIPDKGGASATTANSKTGQKMTSASDARELQLAGIGQQIGQTLIGLGQ